MFDDPSWGGQWFFCRDCKFSGDILELAAKTWGKTREAAAAKLRHLHLIIPQVSETGFGPQQKLASRWSTTRQFHQTLRQRLNHSTAASSLIRELGWQSTVPAERFAAGPGHLYGTSTKKELEDVAYPWADRIASGKYNPNSNRFFAGSNWTDVTCVPFFDQPNRLCGCFAIGRQADPEKDYVYVPFRHAPHAKQADAHYEAGLAYHPSILQTAKDHKHRVLAVRDAVLAVKLQCRHFEMSTQPLPVVVWHSSRRKQHMQRIETRTAWSLLYRERITFWMPDLCPITFAQAIRTNGLISTLRPTVAGDDWTNFLGSRQPAHIVKSVFESALPWSKVLDGLFQKLDSSAAEEFLLRLVAEGVDVRDAASRCSPRLSRMVKETLQEERQFSLVPYGGQAVYVSGDCLYRARGTKHARSSRPELLADAVLEIDTIIHQKSNNDAVWCRGHVRYKDESIPFCEEQSKLEGSALRWMQNFLIQQQKGLLQFNRCVDTNAFHLFTQLHPPRFVTGLDRIGWDPQKLSFVFPKFSITSQAEIELHDPDSFIGKMPASSFEPPRGCSSADVDRLLDGNHATLWACIIASLTSLLSHVYKQAPTTVGLLGSGAEGTGRSVADAIGCAVTSVSTLNDVARGKKTVKQHHFPTLTRFNLNASAAAKKLWLTEDIDLPLNSIVPLDHLTAQLKQLTGEWLIVVSDKMSRFDETTAHAVRVVISHYLQLLSKKRLSLPDREHLTLRIAQDLQNFIKGLGCKDYARVLDALPHLRGTLPMDAAEAFAEFISDAVRRGELAYAEEDLIPAGRPCVYHDEDHLFVDKNVFNKLIMRCGFNPPDGLTVTLALTNAQVLVGELNNCWVVPKDWWLAHYNRSSVLAAGVLKIHS